MSMETTRILAEHLAAVRYETLPSEAVEKAKLCILDFLANVHGAHKLDAVAKVAGYIRSLEGPETASAIGCDFKTGIHNAAFLNGTAAEAIEAQDGLRFGGNHPAPAVIPAALALAEQLGSSGKQVIAAIVAGYEASGRIAASVHPQHTLSGFLPTGTCGAFGAATAAALLMGFDSQKLLDALGNAGMLLPLSMAETLMGGYSAKILQGGQAASAGLTAAGLAEAGIAGPPYVLEGSHLNGGFAKITSGTMDPHLERITDNLGQAHSIMDIYFKPFTACRHTHGCAQAALALSQYEPFSVDEIESIEAHTYGIAAIATGKPVTAESSFVSAQFSIPYVTAACLIDGQMGPHQVTPERIADPKLQALAAKVNIHMDSELNNAYPENTASRLEIKLTGDRRLVKQIDVLKGDPRDPMELDDLAAKFKAFAPDLEPADQDRIIASVMELENLDRIGKSPLLT
jgi:2-methylcitrate dehydratase PrpD